MAMKQSTREVIKYLQAHNGENMTAADIAEALGVEKRVVDGVFTSAVQRKDLGYREEVEVLDNETGRHKVVKLLRLNDAGLALDVDAEE